MQLVKMRSHWTWGGFHLKTRVLIGRGTFEQKHAERIPYDNRAYWVIVNQGMPRVAGHHQR